MSIGRTLYWLLTGALIGFGFIASASIGFPFLILGLILLPVGAIRLGGRGLWAGLVGLGGLPTLILVWDVTSAPWACQPDNGELSLPNVSYYTCVDTFAGQLTTYHVLAFGFGVIALAGLAWPLLSRVWRRARRRTP
jgi:hypothetical protein